MINIGTSAVLELIVACSLPFMPALVGSVSGPHTTVRRNANIITPEEALQYAFRQTSVRTQSSHTMSSMPKFSPETVYSGCFCRFLWRQEATATVERESFLCSPEHVFEPVFELRSPIIFIGKRHSRDAAARSGLNERYN